MKKIFTFFAIFALIIAFSIPTYATDSSDTHTTDSSLQAETVEQNGIVSIDTEQIATPDADGDNAAIEAEGSENVFALLYQKVSENFGEILTALSLLLTALLSFAYKKGLIPVMTSGLSAIGGAISSIKESAERGAGELGEKGEKMIAAAEIVEKTVTALEKKLTELEQRLSVINGLEQTQAATKIILGCQIDTLAEIFSSSALPEYKKEELYRRIAEMKEALADVTKESN